VFELLAEMTDPSPLRDIGFNDLTSKKIAELARKKDPIAMESFDRTGRWLGISLANFVAFSVPEAFILFGGLAAAGELIFEPTRRYMEQHLLGNFKNKIKIIGSGLTHNNSAVLGAAALAWSAFGKE
jgi:glucokinase